MSQIMDVTAPRFEAAVDTLARAFADYPVFTFVLPLDTPEREHKLAAVMRYYAWRRFVRGWPLLAVERNDRLQGVIAANPPNDGTPPPGEADAERELVAAIGAEAERRRRDYESASGSGFPEVPRYFIGMLGVHPEARGEGLGALLMQEILTLSRAHPESQGIALCTESQRNLAFYEGLGYEVVDHVAGESVESWSLWRWND